MKAILKAAIVGALVVVALPQNSDAFSLPSIFNGGRGLGTVGRSNEDAQRPVLLAQATDPTIRMQQLEEDVRKLTGQVQDLNYQLLQMQEQMRQMQKDNEFRFQQLEKGAGAPAGGSDHSQITTPPSHNAQASTQDGGSQSVPGVEMGATGSTSGGPPVAANNGRGAPPSSLGTMTLDSNGNPLNMTIGQPGSNASGPDVASVPSSSSSPQDIYKAAYNNILNGNYKAAESGFRDYLDIFPDGSEASDAMFWLGESQFSQGAYDKAAKTFLDAHQKYPKAEKAPETLLKLGMALAALNNRDTACATYHEVLRRYPKASGAVRQKVASEEKRAGCA